EFPQLLARRRVQAVQLAVGVLMETFADIDSAVGHARRREHILHVAARVEHPDFLAGLAIDTVDGSTALEGRGQNDTDVDMLAVHHRRRRHPTALDGRAKAPGHAILPGRVGGTARLLGYAGARRLV